MNRDDLLQGFTFVIDLILINIIYLIMILPLFTMGASTIALNKTVTEVIYEYRGHTIKNFFVLFKKYFIVGTRFFAIHLVLFSLFFYGFVITYRGPQFPFINVLFGVLLIILLLSFQFGSYLVNEDMSIKTLFKTMLVSIKDKWYIISMFFVIDIVVIYAVVYIEFLLIFVLLSFSALLVKLVDDKLFD
jgi:hypothetical protein